MACVAHARIRRLVCVGGGVRAREEAGWRRVSRAHELTRMADVPTCVRDVMGIQRMSKGHVYWEVEGCMLCDSSERHVRWVVIGFELRLECDETQDTVY